MKLNVFPCIALLVLTAVSTPASADPSGRVGRISDTQGAVTFRSAGYTDAAIRNWPITSGNSLATDTASRAEIRVGSAAVRLDGNTDLDIVELDDTRFHLRIHRGNAVIHIRNADLARDVEIDTPQGRILLSEPSQLRIDVRDDAPVTMLSVLSGSASFDAPDSRFSIAAGRRAEVAGNELRVIELRTALRDDDFDRWSALRERNDVRSVSANYVSAETTGYEELDTHGDWRVTSLYGPVWSPRVIQTGWAPYRDGRWTWVAPWGWTWVDSAPWGYAPSHYGRWVWLDQRWGWAPGNVVARPVWAPALVGWVGGSSPQRAYAVGVAPSVGWFPLAPREAYVPAYRVSPRYIQQINTTIVNHVVVNNSVQVYQNRNVSNAVTVMPHARFIAQNIVQSAPPDNDRTRLARAAPAVAVMPQTMTTLPSPQPLPAAQPPARQPDSAAWQIERNQRREARQARNADALPDQDQARRHQQSGLERRESPRPSPQVAATPAIQTAVVAAAPLTTRRVDVQRPASPPGQVREHRSERDKPQHRHDHPER
ncbi:DUF6600 domain-containing protein [Actimicrobium antarcticum]|uniref:FecR protein domain-containing protein n=1 Tax=Actimicrobium antarcticum TaxID=1051899 RepID=A0ABP7TY72_9BURK